MAITSIQFTLRSLACAVPLAIATAALADNLFAPPPDPMAMAPMQVAPTQPAPMQVATEQKPSSQNVLNTPPAAARSAIPEHVEPIAIDKKLFGAPTDPMAMAPMQVAPTQIATEQKPLTPAIHNLPPVTASSPIPRAAQPNPIDTRLFNAPPDPFTMSPIQLPVEPAALPMSAANPAVALSTAPPQGSIAGMLQQNEAAATTPQNQNDIQLCVSQTDPANFPQSSAPALLPSVLDITAGNTNQPVQHPEEALASTAQLGPPPPEPDGSVGSQASAAASTINSASAPQGSSGCNACNQCCNDCCRRDWWVNVDYLALWIQANHLPPLVTTSPAGTPRSAAGVLPGATILFGNDYVDGGARNGGRVTLGYWFDDDHNNAIEASWFTVGQPTGAANFFANSAGLPILARPFTSGGVPNAQLAAYPGVVMGEPHTPGTIGVTTRSSMDLGEIIFQHVFDRDERTQYSWTAGYRHLEFREGLTVLENMISTDATNPNFTPGTELNLLDQFQDNNDFEGGQLGLQFMRTSGYWTLNGLTKLGFGNVHEWVNIQGNTTVTDPIGNITHIPGLLAQPSNDGVHSRNVLCVPARIGTEPALSIDRPNRFVRRLHVLARHSCGPRRRSNRHQCQLDAIAHRHSNHRSRQRTYRSAPRHVAMGPRHLRRHRVAVLIIIGPRI